MTHKPVDLGEVRRIEARLDQLIAEHPELVHNPERQQALADWLETLEEKEEANGTSEDR